MEQERKKQTEARLLQCAKQEFLQAGYRYANLRNICKAAGVTTGAFYFSFSSKEALFSAILEPLIEEYERLAAELAGKEEEHPETAEENERQLALFLAEHREEAILLLEKSAGSRYEGFRDRIEQQMQAAFGSYFEKYLGKEPDRELMRILVSMRMQGFLEIWKGDYTMEQQMKLTRNIGAYADAGTLGLIEYLKEEKDAHR